MHESIIEGISRIRWLIWERDTPPGLRQEGIGMLEIIFALVSLGILAVEIIEVRQKCEPFLSDTCICEEMLFPPRNSRA